MEKPICSLCGSSNVVKDAWAEWDVQTQDWELHSTYDDNFCNSCKQDSLLEWVPVEATSD